MSKNNKGTQIEIVDQTYRLAEMADAIRQSIANAQNVAKEQARLVDIVSNSDAANDFAEFITSCKSQINNINEQIAKLNIKAGLLDNVVDSCNKDANAAKLISVLLKALGIFDHKDDTAVN